MSHKKESSYEDLPSWSYYLPFILRCVHSLSGLAFTLFLCEHLLTNQLAASYWGWGKGFIAMVDRFHTIPGLKVIEITCLALPFLCHAIIGIVYLLQGKSNSSRGDGSVPSLPFARNYAYTWQRVTAWIILFGLLFHIVHLRFVRYPLHIHTYGQSYYVVGIEPSHYSKVIQGTKDFFVLYEKDLPVPQIGKSDLSEQDLAMLPEGKVYLFTRSAGQAFLYVVRDSLSSFWMAALYTLLVLASAYHGFNGLWTLCCRWGVVVSFRAQLRLRYICYGMMVGVAALGVSVIWDLYRVM
ncbi:succinate dehydrogenase cytochrome b558 subunit [Chlamydia pecorum]|uniref:Succinate dehydrogenase n=1 Tax=Chlamydia pecorum (strain ATCC VR-628 / DSM 29919 / E58) TaxID=331635 RepID=A0AA34RCL8_CHLPE|nr:succinate dehydrogenase cytochrome b558 subunit [Chlamydia pecorum]AEB41263.1 succinate dehydrogenase [Chlamydia pecorum E58]UFP06839.1 succinate dehydrogenase cytochrome b558 subunit [Chlamydia pecorum]UJT76645.1 succinate dehydrogenase [Chlamydia pecorum]